MVMFYVEYLVKSYKNCKVVKDVSFYVNMGEIVGLFGLNGVGKIILFYMVVGLVCYDNGIICIDYEDISLLFMYDCVK